MLVDRSTPTRSTMRRPVLWRRCAEMARRTTTVRRKPAGLSTSSSCSNSRRNASWASSSATACDPTSNAANRTIAGRSARYTSSKGAPPGLSVFSGVDTTTSPIASMPD